MNFTILHLRPGEKEVRINVTFPIKEEIQMAFLDFDALKDKAQDLLQTGVNKSKQLGELAKLNLSMAGEEDTIRKAYAEVGKLYYAEKGMAPDPEFAALCEKITAAKVNIEETRTRIEALKAEGVSETCEAEPVADDGPIIPPPIVPEEPTVSEEPVVPTDDVTPPQE